MVRRWLSRCGVASRATIAYIGAARRLKQVAAMRVCLCLAAAASTVLAAAAPALADGPPGEIAPRPSSSAAAAAVADNDPAARSGFLQASLGVGPVAAVIGELRLGWQFNRYLGVFGSLGRAVALESEAVGISFTGLGARIWSNAFYVEGQVDWARRTSSCELDEPCVERHQTLGHVGVGGELVRTRHFGLELRGEVIFDGSHKLLFGTFGLGFYL
jgi:hypothetical protein